MPGLRASAPRGRGNRPTDPWTPGRLQVHGINRRMQKVWETDGRTGEKIRRARPRFDVRFRVDGYEFRYSFPQKGWADAYAGRLQEGHAKDWLFDPASRQYVAPATIADADAEPVVTVASHLTEYAQHKWAQWEPSTRRNAQRDLSRACVYLVRDDAPEMTAADRVALDDYLRAAVLTGTPGPVDDGEKGRWVEWLARWSLPLADVTDRHLQAFLDHVRTTALDGTERTLAPASLARTRAVVRGAFTAARKRRLLDWDPFDAVDTPVLRDRDQVDPDLVMSPADVIAIARACAQIDPRYEAFVLIQGLCGLRPGEAVELRVRNLTITDGRPTAVTVRGTHAEVPDRFLLDGETRRRPLKGRGHRASRTIPVFAVLAPVVARHVDAYTDGRDASRVFTNTVGSKINLSNFHRDIWDAACTATFPADSPLRQVRRHDLRHAAITAWLNAGVPLKTCQAWSGHATVSVLLDTYLGAVRGDDQLGQTRVDAALHGLLDNDHRDESDGH